MPDNHRAFLLEPTMKFFTYLTLFIALIFSGFGHAHKMKSAFTLVLWNENSGHLEVLHRFILHDAEDAAWQLFNRQADIISDEKTQAQFAQYVVDQFSLKDQTGQKLTLNLVGFQNDEGYFWVYQDIPLPKNLTKLKIRQDVLRQIWREQINVVNVDYKGHTQSISFSGEDKWLSVDLQGND